MSFIPGLHSFDGNSTRQKKIDLSGKKSGFGESKSVGGTPSRRRARNAPSETTMGLSRVGGNRGGPTTSSGSRNLLTKEETLTRAKREREQRHRARVEMKAALVVQKHWRSVMALRVAKQRMRVEEEREREIRYYVSFERENTKPLSKKGKRNRNPIISNRPRRKRRRNDQYYTITRIKRELKNVP